MDNWKDTKGLFRLINKLTNNNKDNPLPYKPPEVLAEEFATYFLEKIRTIWEKIINIKPFQPETKAVPQFRCFAPLTSKVYKIIMSMKSKSCELDTVPTHILKEILPACLDSVTTAVNLSLTTEEFSGEWKTAIVWPLLKKTKLELINKNYRLVSNLCFISKVVEKCMEEQHMDYCLQHNLLADFQSAYCKNYSTQISLLNITNDILWGMENQEITTMLILDLSAAFDTVDHDLLLTIMEQTFGVKEKALKWFDNYLMPRYFKVCIDGRYLESKNLTFSTPQGSCSGANLFSCYCSLITAAIPNSLDIKRFADDHSIRAKYKASNTTRAGETKKKLGKTLNNIKEWMDTMRLKLNSDKTEYIQFRSRQQIKKIYTSPINANGDLIPISYSIWYLGGYVDTNLTFSEHVKQKVKTAVTNFVKIWSIRQYLLVSTCTTLVLMLCISHIDYTNGMLYGTAQRVLKKYQTQQKMCAKLVLGKSKYDSASQALQQLHWLLVQERIHHKILTLTHKCIHGQALEYLKNLIEIKVKHNRNMCSNENGLLLRKPCIKHQTFASHSFKCAAPELWNELPLHIREIKDVTAFKHQLKTHLFRKAFLI